MHTHASCRNLLGAVAACMVLAGSSPHAFAGEGPQRRQDDVFSMDLEQLGELKVTSFRNKSQNLSEVAGAVYVITREQIERTGLTSVPELLRLVPGLQVARVNASQWSISSRGPMGILANKLLVMIDGRSIYSPIYSGVYWDLGMPMVEDIDRIEVIRGPGATIWGANAVLGVINIVTRSARETRETLVSVGGGTAERAFARIRFGGGGKRVAWRGYVTGESHAAFAGAAGESAMDGWNTEQAGFRVDGEQDHGSWMLEGGISGNSGSLTVVEPRIDLQRLTTHLDRLFSKAANLTGEYRRALKKGELRINLFYDQTDKQVSAATIGHARVFDGQIRYDVVAGRRNSISVGAGARGIQARVPGVDGTHMVPPDMDFASYNTFAQDEVRFWRDRMVLTFGTKLEHSPFTGWGAEPSASLLWQATKRHSFWMSAARALRTPSVLERTVISPLTVYPGTPETGGLPVELIAYGGNGFGNETVTDYQVGYRGDPMRGVTLSVALYRDRFKGLRSSGAINPRLQLSPVLSLAIPLDFRNYMDGDGRGAETTITWQRSARLKLEGSHTYMIPRSWRQPEAPASVMAFDLFNPPRNRWTLHASLNPMRRVEADANVFWTGATGADGFQGPASTPAHTRLDARIGYKLGERWRVSLTGQNLLDARHLEGSPEVFTTPSYVRRGVYLQSVWRF